MVLCPFLAPFLLAGMDSTVANKCYVCQHTIFILVWVDWR